MADGVQLLWVLVILQYVIEDNLKRNEKLLIGVWILLMFWILMIAITFDG